MSLFKRADRANPPPARGTVRGFLGGVLTGLFLLGLITSNLWPTIESRMPVADATARAVCAKQPQPRECQPGGRPSSLFGDWMVWWDGLLG